MIPGMSTIYDLPYLKGTAHENNKDPEKHTLPHSLPFTPLFIKNNKTKIIWLDLAWARLKLIFFCVRQIYLSMWCPC